MTNIVSPAQLKRKFPLDRNCQEFIENSRNKIKNILDGNDSRLLLIVGPCSIHDITAAKDYATKLKEFSEEIQDTFFVVMRTYFEKPRTSLGWKGLVQDPMIDSTYRIDHGLEITRELLVELAEMNLPAACEFLQPSSNAYFSDLISWGCIGARTTTSQIHREISSGLPMPVGFKNSTDGNVENAINGIRCALTSQTHMDINEQGALSVVHTKGNKYAHVVLRGSDEKPNYDPASISTALSLLQKAHLPPRLLVDCSHGNSMRKHEEQVNVFQSLLQQVIEGNTAIKGLLLESNLFSGNQSSLAPRQYGISITDPCLDWQSTKKLIRWGREKLREKEKKALSPSELHHSGTCV